MNNFPAKILMFGEYGIIKGSKGVAIPFDKHFGQLKQAKSHSAIQQKLRLDEFCDYLKGSSILGKAIDIESFEKDIKTGYFFDSNIPHGYGIGSSGALCAAIYAKYAYDFQLKTNYEDEELRYLKDMMALMESFYHGSSSGIDCLISLIKLPVLIKNRSNIKLIEPPDLDKFGRFYLYDSGRPRSTACFVTDFMEKYETDTQYKSDINIVVEYTDLLADQLIEGRTDEFEKNFYNLSRLQYLHFSKMIPEQIKSLWLEGLESKKYFFKLCGAGGGGYFLVYTQDQETIRMIENETNYLRV